MRIVNRLRKHLTPIIFAILIASALAGSLTGLALASAQGSASLAPQAAAQPNANVSLQQPTPSSDGTEKCAGCHPDVVKGWTNSPHHLAYSDKKFQTAWETEDKNRDCLQCHTTGYSPANKTYQAEGVSCTACHGPIPDDHPATPVDLSIANNVCKECHTTTFAEFRASLHEAKGLQCTSCHYAHENGLRLGDQVTQCTNCHALQLDDFAHASHVNAGLKCRNCHGYVNIGQEVPVDGLVPTGHDFRESTRACLDCHKEIHLTVNGDTAPQQFDAKQAQQSFVGGEKAALRITELENQVKTVELQNQNNTLVGAVQGGLGGLVLGSVAVGVVLRNRRRLTDDGGGPGEP